MNRRDLLPCLCLPVILVMLVLVWSGGIRHATASQSGSVAETAAGNPDNPKNLSREALFQKIFKHSSPPIPVETYLQLIINGKKLDKVSTHFNAGRTDFTIPAPPILGAISNMLTQAALASVKAGVDADGRISNRSMRSSGLITKLDQGGFQLTIDVPADMRGTQVHDMRGGDADPYAADVLHPADFSAFLNFSSKLEHDVTRFTGNGETTEDRLGNDFNGAMNYRGFVLEGEGLYQEEKATSFTRGNFRMVHDRPLQALRFTAGDLRYNTIGYQSVINMGGVGMAKDFSLQPQIKAYQVRNFEFYLERSAEVEVWVNDSRVDILNLEPGTHDIRGFSPYAGKNDMRLEIEDVTGRRQTLDYGFIYDPALLAEGEDYYSANLGLLRRIENDDYRYDRGVPVFSGFYERGISTRQTLGVYGQAAQDRYLAGLLGVRAFDFGKLTADVAGRLESMQSVDFASSLTFTHLPSYIGKDNGLSWQAEIEYREGGFDSVAVSTPENSDRLGLFLSADMPIGLGIYGKLTGRYEFPSDDDELDPWSLSLGVSKRWFRQLQAHLTFRHSRDETGQKASEALVGLSWSFYGGHHTYTATRETEGDVELRYDYRQQGVQGQPFAGASARHNNLQMEYNGKLGYTGNQGEVSVAHRRIDSHRDEHPDEDRTSLVLQNAMAYADGQLALSRSIRDGFVLVKGINGLDSTAMTIDPDGAGGCQAHSNWFGPAVLPNLSAYRLKKLQVTPEDPPLGAVPDKTHYTLFPTYKSGFAVTLGRPVSLIAVGKLVNAQGQPISHQPLEIQRSDGTGTIYTATTNRSGRFQVQGLQPGRFDVRPQGTGSPLQIEILTSSRDFVQLGSLRVVN